MKINITEVISIKAQNKAWDDFAADASMAEWASQEDAEGFYRDMMLHGRAYKEIRADGKARWFPLLETRRAPAKEEG